MSVYNSSVADEKNDTSSTLIRCLLDDNDSIKYSNNDNNSLQHLNGYESYTIYEEIENIILFYWQDLEQEANTQHDCCLKLIQRLMDIIRPAYSSQNEKLEELDKLFENISSLHKKRSTKQNEEDEKFQNERLRLERLIIRPNNQGNCTMSTTSNVYSETKPIFQYDEYQELEKEILRLNHILIAQTNKLNELVEYVSKSELSSPSINNTNSDMLVSASTTLKTTTGNTDSIPSPITINQSLPRELRICPICQAIFNISLDKDQFKIHIQGHE